MKQRKNGNSISRVIQEDLRKLAGGKTSVNTPRRTPKLPRQLKKGGK